ncbi:hypothetical protein LTR53_005784 [Teratosphaeriaceae sp. CCFEE 6253]|nr:hypothetical protein LTR53_005784 [Teratosphaeriaceae sp. CCFEE 6253]
MATTSSRTPSTSQQATDNSFQPFLQPDFDPADYLNITLPTLSITSAPRAVQNARAVPLAELNAQLQSLLSQINAQMTRLSNTLTQLTDEIIRSGSRLAYEVEVLRGDATGLTDTLENGLRKDIELFTGDDGPGDLVTGEEELQDPDASPANGARSRATAEPEYLEKLRTLTAIRSRLDSVIKVFGDAMAWPLAPSELLTSSLISVSAPEPEAETRDRQEKGIQYMDRLRSEINDLVGAGNDQASLTTAAARVDVLRELAEVWKGTAEEKARLRLVDGLQRPIEERQRALERAGQARRPAASPARGVDLRYGDLNAQRATSEGGYGFLQNLRNLKNEMYLE